MSARTALRAALGRPYLRRALALKSGDSVLDAGCGPGHWLQWLAAARSDLYLVGVDRRRHPTLATEVNFLGRDLDAEPLPFADGSFQLVVCAHVLEHLGRPTAVIGELARVLSPGGLLYVELPSERSLRVPSAPRWLDPRPPLAFHDEPTHVWAPHSPQALASRLTDAGLRVEEAGRARSPGRWLSAGPRLARGLLARDGRAFVESIEHLGGLASYAIATR